MVGNQLAAAFGQSTMPSTPRARRLAIRPSALTLLACTSLLSTGLVGTRSLQSTQVSPSVSLQSNLMPQFFPAELTLDIIGRDEEA